MHDLKPLISELKEMLKCSDCGKPITEGSKTGRCRSCAQRRAIVRKLENSKRRCPCGRKIIAWNGSGLCSKCIQRRRRYFYQHDFSSWRAEARRKKKAEKQAGKKGRCRTCKKEFNLEGWQHSSLHWCPKCQKSDVYKNFASNQKIRERFCHNG